MFAARGEIMPTNKIKILATLGFVTLIASVLIFAPNFSANAEGDEFVKEIANYKNWTKITKEPIVVKIDEAALVGS
jgi:hypothetical protein